MNDAQPLALQIVRAGAITTADLNAAEAKLVAAFRTMSRIDATMLLALAQRRSFEHVNEKREHGLYMIPGWRKP